MDFKELKARMVLQDINNEDLAQKIGVSKSAFYRKMNGTTEFTRDEIQKIIDILHINSTDAIRIFFGN